jgi:hypothetical protein
VGNFLLLLINIMSVSIGDVFYHCARVAVLIAYASGLVPRSYCHIGLLSSNKNDPSNR